MTNAHATKLDPVEQGLVIDGEYDSRRTVKQNKLYWALLRKVAHQVGAEAEYLHTLFKNVFLPDFGVASTTCLTSKGFHFYIDAFAHFLEHEGNIHLNLPAFDHAPENSQEGTPKPADGVLGAVEDTEAANVASARC